MRRASEATQWGPRDRDRARGCVFPRCCRRRTQGRSECRERPIPRRSIGNPRPSAFLEAHGRTCGPLDRRAECRSPGTRKEGGVWWARRGEDGAGGSVESTARSIRPRRPRGRGRSVALSPPNCVAGFSHPLRARSNAVAWQPPRRAPDPSLRWACNGDGTRSFQTVDDDFIDIGRRLDDGVFNLARERPENRGLGRGTVPWVYLGSRRAFRNLDHIETQSVNAEIRPQALHRPSDPGLQVVGMETMQEQDRPHLLVFREPRQGNVVCTRNNSHEPRQRDPVQVKDKLYQFARGCPGSRISELTESLNQLLDPSQCCIKTAFVVHVSDRPTPNIGECTVSS